MSMPDEANHLPEMSTAQLDTAVRLTRDLNPQAKLEMDEPAFAGILYRCGGLPPVAVYDVEKILEILEEAGSHDPMDEFNYGPLRALPYGGDSTEAFCHFSYDEAEGDFLDLPEFGDAFLGLVEHCAFKSSACGYAFDKKKCVEIIMERDQVDSREAEISFAQILSTHDGGMTPSRKTDPVIVRESGVIGQADPEGGAQHSSHPPSPPPPRHQHAEGRVCRTIRIKGQQRGRILVKKGGGSSRFLLKFRVRNTHRKILALDCLTIMLRIE